MDSLIELLIGVVITLLLAIVAILLFAAIVGAFVFGVMALISAAS